MRQNKQKNIINTLETPHLLLRQPSADHTSILSHFWRNQIVRQFLGGIVSDEVSRQRIAAIQQHWKEHGFGQWIVCGIDGEQQIMGICGLHLSEPTSSQDRNDIEISYMFLPEFWGKGYAIEASMACLQHGFESLGLERIIAITQAANDRSCRLLEKIGMRHSETFSRYNAAQRLYAISQTEFDKSRNNFS